MAKITTITDENDEGVQVRRKPVVRFDTHIEPQDDDDEGTPAPTKAKRIEFEDVEIGGKKYKVQKGAGEAISAANKKPSKSAADEMREMMEEFTSKMTPPKKKVKSSEEDDGGEGDDLDEAMLFTEPKKFFKKFKESLSKDLVSQISGLYNQDQGQRQFWSDFYGANEGLRDYDFIVKAVLNQNMKELGKLQTNDAAKKLAELTKDRLMEIARKVSKGSGEKNKFHVEGASRSRIDSDSEEEATSDDDADRKAGLPMTMSALLKMRKEKRRRSSQHEEAED